MKDVYDVIFVVVPPNWPIGFDEMETQQVRLVLLAATKMFLLPKKWEGVSNVSESYCRLLAYC